MSIAGTRLFQLSILIYKNTAQTACITEPLYLLFPHTNENIFIIKHWQYLLRALSVPRYSHYCTWFNPPQTLLFHSWSPELLLVMSPMFSIHIATPSSGKPFWNASGITWEPAASGKPPVMGEIRQLPLANSFRGLPMFVFPLHSSRPLW